jgi:hypothetical protein
MSCTIPCTSPNPANPAQNQNRATPRDRAT